jgi:uncharacterized membrane protein
MKTLHELRSRRVTRNINRSFDERMTLGDRLADQMARFAGSWTFILLFGGLIAVWMLINIRLMAKPFDPFPFILLNLILSTLAAIQAPVIMMSQNRQSSKDRMQAEHDYEINLKAEAEIALLHVKLDAIQEAQLEMLLAGQTEAMGVLRRLEGRL